MNLSTDKAPRSHAERGNEGVFRIFLLVPTLRVGTRAISGYFVNFVVILS
jgi:hypothetical protein